MGPLNISTANVVKLGHGFIKSSLFKLTFGEQGEGHNASVCPLCTLTGVYKP